MKRTLVLPCAGRSTRYPGTRPKWMLTTPSGELALQKAVSSVARTDYDRLVLGILQEHEQTYRAKDIIRRALGPSAEVVVLENPTQGPAETVQKVIEQAKISGPICIKDSDSWFKPQPCPDGSYLAVTDLRLHLEISRVAAKSFAIINEQGLVVEVVEKSVVSNFISSGLYGFASAAHFLEIVRAFKPETNQPEVFVSHVISHAIARGEPVVPLTVDALVDVGTLVDWNNYTKRCRTYICDIDGVVFRNHSLYIDPTLDLPEEPISENIDVLRTVQQEGAQLVFMTSRPEAYREKTMAALIHLDLHVHALIMNCHHSRRVLINDYAPSNPFPSAVAINVPRNSNELGQQLRT